MKDIQQYLFMGFQTGAFRMTTMPKIANYNFFERSLV